MKTYTIDKEYNITAYESAEAAKTGEGEPFTTEADFTALAADWPGTRLVEIWNSLPGVKPVKQFQSRATGVTRIWKAIQNLGITATPTPEPQRSIPASGASPSIASGQAREGSKKARVIEMLKGADGVTLAEIVAATEWQVHTVRGFISGALVKKGVPVRSFKREDGTRAYCLS